ncbi:hypothetical protein [Oryzifoliimicrobium ureilyticus]|uniref:hypothetical protein n=1 Tax=Oryzifoliimicrobium ureilyticus TaxID=3113724 RepID=UPI0030763337
MIEYALLFGLGFLTAAFLVFLMAPAVHRRVVWYTEKRMIATMPLSPQEVRAQKDMVRALYAAENARTAQELAREREKALGLQIERDKLAKEASRLTAETGMLEAQIASMSLDAAELRSQIRANENRIAQLRASLEDHEELTAKAENALEPLKEEIKKLTAEIATMKFDLSSRDSKITKLSAENRALRKEQELLEQSTAGPEHHPAVSHQPAPEVEEPEKIESAMKNPETAELQQESATVNAALAEDLRARATALSEKLSQAAQNGVDDETLRTEIADVAARLVAMTAQREGKTSPILPLLENLPPVEKDKRTSLAQRAAELLSTAK